MRSIWVTFQAEGIHMYPAANEDPSLADVNFLGLEHRHMFHFKVWIEVFHNDRDIEFIQFKRWCQNLYNNYDGVLSFNYKSCEMLADELAEAIQANYPGRYVKVSVAEDNENGCEIDYPAQQNK